MGPTWLKRPHRQEAVSTHLPLTSRRHPQGLQPSITVHRLVPCTEVGNRIHLSVCLPWRCTLLSRVLHHHICAGSASLSNPALRKRLPVIAATRMRISCLWLTQSCDCQIPACRGCPLGWRKALHLTPVQALWADCSAARQLRDLSWHLLACNRPLSLKAGLAQV